MSWLFLVVEFKVFQEPQDLPVLRSLSPKKAELRANKLVAADAGSAHYLKRYEQLMRQTAEQNEEDESSFKSTLRKQ